MNIHAVVGDEHVAAHRRMARVREHLSVGDRCRCARTTARLVPQGWSSPPYSGSVAQARVVCACQCADARACDLSGRVG